MPRVFPNAAVGIPHVRAVACLRHLHLFAVLVLERPEGEIRVHHLAVDAARSGGNIPGERDDALLALGEDVLLLAPEIVEVVLVDLQFLVRIQVSLECLLRNREERGLHPRELRRDLDAQALELLLVALVLGDARVLVSPQERVRGELVAEDLGLLHRLLELQDLLGGVEISQLLPEPRELLSRLLGDLEVGFPGLVARVHVGQIPLVLLVDLGALPRRHLGEKERRGEDEQADRRHPDQKFPAHHHDSRFASESPKGRIPAGDPSRGLGGHTPTVIS